MGERVVDLARSASDADALLDLVEVDRLRARVDVVGRLAQTDLGALIARSSGGVASNALDVAWLSVYFAYSWTASGKAFGMALPGVRAVR